MVAPDHGGVGHDPAAQGSSDVCSYPPGERIAEWTLLIYAANDDRDPSLVAAFDQDAVEWQRGLGGSSFLRILVERDYASFQVGPDGAPGRPSERYALYRGQLWDPVSLGETDTTDRGTLERFLVEGVRRFPAKHYWVIVTGRGDGWNGLAFDATTGPEQRLTIPELTDALRAGTAVIRDDIRRRPGFSDAATSERFDVIQFDVCRLGTIEVAAALSDVADAMVASQEVMPDAGHPYGALRCIAEDDPTSVPRALVSAVVTDYVRSYVEGVSTQDRAYVGTAVTSVGLDLRLLRPLLSALTTLRAAVREERPRGFSCSEARALAEQAEARAQVGASGPGVRPDASSPPASGASVDLIALLEALADPARLAPSGALEPRVSQEVASAAREALAVIGRPHLWTPGEPFGEMLSYQGQYREIVTFDRDSPFIVEAHRVDPGTDSRVRGLSVLWGDPLDLLLKENGVSALDAYRGLSYEATTGWTGMFEDCIEQAQACWSWAPDPARPYGPSPCEGREGR